MTTFNLLLIIPLIVWVLIAKLRFKHEFTWGEVSLQIAITSAVIVFLSYTGYSSMTTDTMLVNGSVSSKLAKKQSCDQTWDDWPDSFCTNQYTRTVRDGNTCFTDSKGYRACTPKFKTQYKAVYPWEIRYFVDTNIPSRHEIERVDRQGSNMPPRFAEIQKEDPATAEVTYTNYIKGAADTLFNQKVENVPPIAYPKVYDYYHARRVIYYGVKGSFDFVDRWNKDLAVVNTALAEKKANVIINVVRSDPSWAEGLAQAWDAHNINDVVVTIGVEQETIRWVDVRSWSKNELVDVTIRDEILNIGTLDPVAINQAIKSAVLDYYVARDMSEFRYLADDIALPIWVYILASVLLLVVTPFTTIILSKNKVHI